MDFDIIGYAQSLFLITTAHLIIPPLSYFCTGENPPLEVRECFNALYQCLPTFFIDQNFVYSLLLTKEKMDKLDSTFLTHIFVHGNYQHLLSNLLGTWLYSSLVFRDIGSVYTQLLYLSGGVLSSIPLEKHYQALKKECTKLYYQVLFTDRQSPAVSSSSWLGSTWSFISSKLPKISPFQEIYCGSSGAVSTMMGFDFILQVKEVIVSAGRVYQYSRGTMKRPREEAVLIGALLFRIVQVYSLGNMISGEYLSLVDQQQALQSWFRFFGGKNIINHKAHLQGFAFGALISLLRLAFK